MKSELKDFFHYSRGQRIALLIILALLVAGVLANAYLALPGKQSQRDFSEFRERIQAFLEAGKQASVADTLSRKKQWESPVVRMFRFNPNDLPEAQWKQLGLKDWQIRIIKRYEAGGGKFRSKEDLRRMYSLSAEDFNRLEPWIELPATIARDSLQTRSRKSLIPTIEINTADSTALQLLPGIGPYMASNIIRYRNKLGGFIRHEQLREVYRMKEETFLQIREYIIIDTNQIQGSVKPNTSDYWALVKHPYIDKTLAYSITTHRQRFGKIKSAEEFRKVEGLTDSLYQVLRPYLLIE